MAATELADVDWRTGDLLVRGKGSRREHLPLPVDVGEALADLVPYGRPGCAGRPLLVVLQPTENEKAGLIERRWWTAGDLRQCRDKLLPAELPNLLDDLLAERFSRTPLALTS